MLTGNSHLEFSRFMMAISNVECLAELEQLFPGDMVKISDNVFQFLIRNSFIHVVACIEGIIDYQGEVTIVLHYYD